MSALSQAFQGRELRLNTVALPLAASMEVFQGGIACIDTSANVVKKGASGNANLVVVGAFAESYDNSGSTATAMVLVALDHEVVCRWYDNDTGGNAVSVANLFESAYLRDDHTVGTDSSGNAAAGRIWAVDSVKGVAIEATGL